jgi:PII-like signaling protein
MNRMQRIELIIERMAYKRALRLLESVGAKGATVLPALAGFGQSGKWQRDMDISGASDLVAIIAICDEEAAQKAADELVGLLGSHIGVVSMSEVKVLRPERF